VIATIDADTLLMPTSLRRAVARLVLSPPDTVAVAGSVMARNTRESFMTRVQQWDYFIGIAAVKRQQAFLQGTLVAQGAFSVYETAAVKLAGGWPDRIGEDIVLTWSLLRDGGRVTYEPTAIAFTDTPTGLHALARQRQRWARGMIEGLREHGFALLRRPRMYSHSVAADLLFPYLDTVYSVAVPIGLALALTGNFAIIGPLTLAVLPINFLIALLMFRCELPVFRAAGFRVRRRPLDVVGLTCYGLFLQLLLSPVCVVGYAKELFGSRRSW
jgi:poly-beta-1,6-N-acetyl-D-glucosamine synthase